MGRRSSRAETDGLIAAKGKRRRAGLGLPGRLVLIAQYIAVTYVVRYLLWHFFFFSLSLYVSFFLHSMMGLPTDQPASLLVYQAN